MKRSRLRKVFMRSRDPFDRLAYVRHRNYVSALNKKTKRIYFEAIASQPGTGPNRFWKICKPFLTDKQADSDRIFLCSNDTIISDDLSTANLFNSYFNGITNELNLNVWSPLNFIPSPDPVLNAISKFREHPSIVKIQARFPIETPFNFIEVDIETVEKLVMSLDSKKTTSGNISSRLLKFLPVSVVLH